MYFNRVTTIAKLPRPSLTIAVDALPSVGRRQNETMPAISVPDSAWRQVKGFSSCASNDTDHKVKRAAHIVLLFAMKTGGK